MQIFIVSQLTIKFCLCRRGIHGCKNESIWTEICNEQQVVINEFHVTMNNEVLQNCDGSVTKSMPFSCKTWKL